MPSLNIAMAVQIVGYEILCARASSCEQRQTGNSRAARCRGLREPRAEPLATPDELDRLYEHLAAVLEEIDFRDRTQSGGHLMKRIRRLLQRAEPDANEVDILRGILTAMQQRRRRAGQEPAVRQPASEPHES